MLKVACVLRSGGIYDRSWVIKLAAGVAKHLHKSHEFICLADSYLSFPPLHTKYGNVYTEVHDEALWPGWWSKLRLFALDGPVLFLDLDTLVCGTLDDIAEHAETGKFTMLRDFYRPHGLGSGVMSWSLASTKYVNNILALFARSPDRFMRTTHGGDQAFIESAVNALDVVRWQDVCPGQIVSYKADHCEMRRPPNARLVCLHGKPKFADMKPDCWVRREWESLN